MSDPSQSGGLMGLLAQLQVSLGAMPKQVAAGVAAAQQGTVPTDLHPSGTAIVGTGQFINNSGRCWVDLGAPTQGYVWLLRALTITRSDADITTALAGDHAWVFVTSQPPNLTTLSGLGLRTSTTTLPNTSNWTSRQIVVRANEHIYVVITGGTNGQGVFVEAGVEEYQERGAPLRFEV